MNLKPYWTQRWPYPVMQRALELRAEGLPLRKVADRLAQDFTPAPPWHTVRSWCDGTIIRAARLRMELAA